MEPGTFDEVYQSYFDSVYRYVLSLSRDPHVAEEITQEAFFKTLRSLDQFRGDSSLKSWLCAIAKNIWVSEQKKKKEQPIDEISALPDLGLLGIPLHGRLGLSPSSHGLASSSPDGQPAWHGRRVQGRSPWSLLIFPLIFGAESSPPRSFLTRQEDVRMARAVISHPSIFLKPAINILWQICIGIAKMHGIDFA